MALFQRVHVYGREYDIPVCTYCLSYIPYIAIIDLHLYDSYLHKNRIKSNVFPAYRHRCVRRDGG
jgi:hypothetical protein